MSNEPLYLTHQMLESFAINHYSVTGERLRIQELVQQMKEQNLLLTEKPIRKTIDWEMTKDSFVQAFMDIPICADPILESAAGGFSDIFREEQSAFPEGRDVFCRKTAPCVAAEPRSLSYFELFYVLKGSCEMIFGAEQVPLRQGDMCIVPPNTSHALPLDPGCFVVNTTVRASTFDAQFGDLLTKAGVISSFFRESLYGRSGPNFLLIHADPDSTSVRYHLRGLLILSTTNDKHTNGCVTCGLKLFLSELLRSANDEVEIYRTPVGGSPRADCGEILQYIQQNYRTVRLSSLAREFHYNETYLSRMLQNYAHKSFTEIVRDIRMKRAEEYLNNSALRIHEISALVGYSSVDHFSRAFKSTHGMSPQAYRRRALLDEEE